MEGQTWLFVSERRPYTIHKAIVILLPAIADLGTYVTRLIILRRDLTVNECCERSARKGEVILKFTGSVTPRILMTSQKPEVFGKLGARGRQRRLSAYNGMC